MRGKEIWNAKKVQGEEKKKKKKKPAHYRPKLKKKN